MATDKIYIVTLKKKEDLDGFYADMASDGYKLSLKRPISRNTHYYMEEEDAVEIRKDSRVIAVERHPEQLGIVPKPYGQINFEPYGTSGQFRKGGSFTDPNDKDWGKLSVAGTDVQRRKGAWGSDSTSVVTDTYEMFNNGRHVDVVIVDQPVSWDCEEWKSPSTGQSRFVQYEWYNELNSYVQSIDDDGYTLPTGNYPNYPDNMSNLTSHGIHVAGTVAGKWYGWANEANIYSMGILGGAGGSTIAGPSTMLAFDYLRAFHLYKQVNPETGHRNPTVTNHSWGYSYDMYENGFDLPLTPADYDFVSWDGTVYSPSNPNPSGWTMAGLEADFGMGPFHYSWAMHYASVNADVEDAIQDGVVVIAASGNSDCYHPNRQDAYWNNWIRLSNGTYLYPWRGSSPASLTGTDEVIAVGNMSNISDYSKSRSSNYGPGITVWAPGSMILSSYNNSTGYLDGKYGSPNFFKAISGTSMASPQVCGVAACLATNKMRFTNRDLIGFLEYASVKDEMTWDIGTPGNNYFLDLNGTAGNQWEVSGSDANGAISGTNPVLTVQAGDAVFFKQPYGGSHYYLTSSSSSGYFGHVYDRNSGYGNWQYNQNNYTINVEEGDTLRISINSFTNNEPIYIKTQNTTGTGDQASGVTYQGATSGSIYFDTWYVGQGTYYYCSSANSGASGTINVVAKGSLYNHPLYIVTQSGSTGGSNLWTGSAVNSGNVYYQGETHGQYEGYNRYVYFVTQYTQGGSTIYYQCGAHANMYGEIQIASPPGNINQPGNWADSTRRGGSPDTILTSTNPRDLSKMVGAWNITNNGRRFSHSTDLATLQTVQNFPRTNTLFHN